MPSAALAALQGALPEITHLRRADQTAVAATTSSLELARAVGRGQVVLLSSHFERYFYPVNEEAVTFLNAQNVFGHRLPEALRILHSRQPVDELAEMSWERRADKLREFISGDAWLWSTGAVGAISHGRLLAWMKAPKPERLVRYFKYWGIDDIFSEVTRSPQTRQQLWLGIQELVDKRNNIAHGDFSAQATQTDVRRYIESVRTLCVRVDRKFGRLVSKLSGGTAPW